MGIFSSSEERRLKRERKLTNELRNAIEYETKAKALKILGKFKKPLQLQTMISATKNLADVLCGTEICFNVSASQRVEILQAMVTAGFDVNTKFDGDRTLLHIAASSGDEKTIFFLLDQGVDITVIDEWGKTPLIRAMDSSRWSVAKLLYTDDLALHPENFSKTFRNALNKQAPDDVIKLFLSQLKGKEHEYLQDAVIQRADFFVDHYLGVYNKNPCEPFEDNGFSILMSAIGYQREDVFKKLLDAGFDYQATSPDGSSCLSHSAYVGDQLILHTLMMQCEKDGVELSRKNVLQSAVNGRGVELIPDLVRYGCSPDELVEEGQKPLLLKMLEDNNREAAVKLISAGANVHLADAAGMTAMRYIAEKTDGQLWSVVKMLQGEPAAAMQTAPRATAGNYNLLDRHVIELRQGPLSTVFNFHTGQVITRDTEHGSLHVQDFDRLPRAEALIEAEAMLVQLKGELPEGYSGASGFSKKPTIPSKSR